MEIKDFIKESLLQIIDGVTNANEALAAKGSYIPTKNITGESVYHDSMAIPTIEGVEHYLKIDFDLAVIVNVDNNVSIGGEIGTNNASIQLAFAKLNVDAKASMESSYEHDRSQQSIHRIKCSIPLALPQKK